MTIDDQEWVLYHNGNCSKSRRVYELLEESGTSFSVVNYLENPPSASQLRRLCEKGGFSMRQLVRFGEPLACELKIFPDDTRSENEWAALLHQHPVLIERPVVETATKAIVGRPPEKVTSLWE